MKVYWRALAVFLLIIASLVAAQPPDYQPLSPGWSWTYITDEGGYLTKHVADHLEVHGHFTTVIQCVELAPYPQVYQNYWTKDPDGNVYLHGAWNEDGFLWTYEPPILLVSPPLYPGRNWSSTSRFYRSYDNSSPDTLLTLTYEVIARSDVTVPAGVFKSANVVSVIPQPSCARHGNAYDLLGRCLPAGRAYENGEWVSDGIGRIKDAAWELEEFTAPLPAEFSSWGDVKLLFR